MPMDNTGQKSWPNPIKKQGQLILEYEDHYIFYLKNEKYHTAGYPDRDLPDNEYSEWEEEVVAGNASSEGISLNKAVYKKACKSEKENGKQFFVYDNAENQYLKLVDHDLRRDWEYLTKMNNVPLLVTPADAYEPVSDRDRFDSNIEDLNPQRF